MALSVPLALQQPPVPDELMRIVFTASLEPHHESRRSLRDTWSRSAIFGRNASSQPAKRVIHREYALAVRMPGGAVVTNGEPGLSRRRRP